MSAALARQRQALILEAVRRDGAVRVSDLVEQLGVSDMTIRRDIGELSRRGLVARVHGGAAAPEGRSSEEPGYVAKSALQTEEKRAIGAVAAALVRPGSSVALSAGTTTVEVARALLDVPGLTVVTNSPRVAEVLHEPARHDRTVILTGGIRTPSDALVGPVAVRSLQTLHVDRLFLGVHGLHPDAGLTTPNLVEGETDRALMAAASSVVVVADHTKWGVVGLSTIAALDEVDVLVSDTALPPEAREIARERTGRLLLAGARPGDTGHPGDAPDAGPDTDTHTEDEESLP
ncbi:DeoR/GlpR family transcriptional regulator of sugar metabolism [Kineococcus xinjiangensis]|uniref:DeoR/GlpR family transcriptional regulator of sugar metabolism n=1 Tax=Kineococcus xinjiangensis TaxID=512762 RepID=A0A2S6IU17_9ACTN|nr:DeoR/GlpR family DNA-binding transcription regulator [Kineococcus xinjiangensis]PPK97661.1 DeoR/GlpR family transcriptional regulator of sugar metabolism [Kineococcus xinjiangensis]